MFIFVGNLKLFIMEAKANELRIGNYVNHKELGYVQVYGMNLEVIQFDYRKDPYYDEIPFEKLSYVPLTEEMLLKCGYATCSFRDNHFVIKGHTIWKCKDLFMCDKNGMVLKHLHHLQNLYFSLTNEELTVNL